MPYTPVELRHVRVERAFLGYRRGAVEQLLIEVADSFEDVWRERGELTDKVDALEKQVAELRVREDLLTHTLVAAEQAAVEVREQAKRAADLVVSEAHHEARSITRQSQSERERLFAEARRIEALLRAALGMVEESAIVASPEVAPEVSVDNVEPWPARDDTREFNLNVVPDADHHIEPEAQAG